uniref:C2H2-type domain-containing protein n=1 Tax=Sparus aurata TaxID=8175 RepID=A0A671UA93_SPAAU
KCRIFRIKFPTQYYTFTLFELINISHDVHDDCDSPEPEAEDNDDVCSEIKEPQSSLNSQKNIEVPVSGVGLNDYLTNLPDYCGKHFGTSAKLKLHEKLHSERDKAFLCDVCCKTFYMIGELKVHLRTHTKVTITCTECGKGLSSKEALNRHMIIHAGERPYQCSECGLHFNRMSNLTAHMKIHTGVKLYVCGVCGKACARKTYLMVHMRTHSGERHTSAPSVREPSINKAATETNTEASLKQMLGGFLFTSPVIL